MTRLIHRRRLSVGLLAVLAAVAAAAVLPGRAATASRGVDLVAGQAQFFDGTVQVRINAQSRADGSGARGKFFLSQGGVEIKGRITCLNVSGNAAVAGGVITDSDDPALIGTGFYQSTVDNGSPGGSEQGGSDMSQTTLLPTPPGSVCPSPASLPPGFTAENGNYVVHDAT